MSKLALLVGAGLPLMLAASSAMAQGPGAPPPAAAPASATPAPAAAVVVAPAATPAPAAAVVVTPAPGTKTVVTTDPATKQTTVETSAIGADGKVTIHIETKELVTLQHRAPAGGGWENVCDTPCDARVPAGDEFRIIGEGLNDSEPFALTSPKGDVVKLHVAPGFKKKEKIGKILTITGGVVFVGAAVIGIAAANPGNDFNGVNNGSNYNWDVIIVGTTIAVAGLATGIVGASYWYNNSQTRVAGDVQGEQPTVGSSEPRYLTGMRSNGPVIPAYTTTLFSTTF